MIFSTPIFIVFFLIIILLLYILKDQKQRQYMLLFASYFFYAYWDCRFLFLMIFQTFIIYVLALFIDKHKKDNLKLSKRYLSLGITISLLILSVFKYYNFFIDTINIFLQDHTLENVHIILPLGISFYIFQSMSYLIDVYRDEEQAQTSFLKVSLYISFFPQMVAGPIVRAKEFLPQLETNPPLKIANISAGLQIFLFGLFKKVVIADNLSVFVDQVFETPAVFDSITIILAVISYSIQIYCDFSGYSDMAIGVAMCMGYKLVVNFNMPYLAPNPTDFWRRWHISLSTWLKDYLYVPLGGSYKGAYRTNINLMITMLLGGLWHGASWNFVVWGAIHGIALIIHKLFKSLKLFDGEKIFVKILFVVFNYLFVCSAWIFFRAEDFNTAIIIFEKIVYFSHYGVSQTFLYSIIFIPFFFIVHLFVFFRNKSEGFYIIKDYNKLSTKILISLVILLIICFGYTSSSPFIYFQF